MRAVIRFLSAAALCAVLAVVPGLAAAPASAEEVEMLGDLLRMDVPEEFVPMPPDLRRAKFPGLPDAGSEIFCSPDGAFTVSAHLTDVPFPDDVPAARAILAARMRAAHPGIRLVGDSLAAIGGRFWARCALISPGRDGESRTDMLATSAGGRLLIVSVSAPADADAAWRARAEEMLRGVRLAGEGD